jgi:steroid delta-isomerase-like uncharacterized protein
VQPIDVARAYFDAWNRRDPAAIVALFAEGGTYHDPSLPQPLAGPAIAGYAGGLFAAFPDLTFETPSIVAGGDGLVAAQWLMRGTNAGPLLGLPPTGREVGLPGADFIRVEGDRIRSVQGYFDQQAFNQQLGLQVLVQPRAVGPFTFGQAVTLANGKTTKPAAFSTTWIDARSEVEAKQVAELSQRIAQEMLGLPGFLGALLATVGGCMFTVTAWESAEDAFRLLRSPSHKEAMSAFFGPALGSAVHTSVWSSRHYNPMWVRRNACGQVMNYDKSEGRCRCGQTLPPAPRYW